MVRVLMLFLTMILFISGCQTKNVAEIEIKVKSEEEQRKMLEEFTRDDYRKIYEETVAEAEEYGIKDKELHKWVMRILADEKLLYETDLTRDQVLQLSEERMKEAQAWKAVARDKFGVTVSDEEVDKVIKEGPDTSDLPQHLAYADALGMTLEKLNHEFDRDLYERYAIWLKLRPKLAEKYETEDDQKLFEKYQKEVEKRLK